MKKLHTFSNLKSYARFYWAEILKHIQDVKPYRKINVKRVFKIEPLTCEQKSGVASVYHQETSLKLFLRAW